MDPQPHEPEAEVPPPAAFPPAPPRLRTAPGHPRDLVCESAGREMAEYLNAWAEKHDLTQAEYAYLLGVAALRQVQAMCAHERGFRP